MADPAAPRLDPTAGPAPGYAPLSWAAVASAAVSGLYLALVGVLAVQAAVRKVPLYDERLLALAAVGVLLAFVARRQIADADGTRTGGGLAAAGWWMGVAGGLAYLAYLTGVSFAIRADAERQFRAFAEAVAKADPDAPADPAAYDAVLWTVPPGQRPAARGKSPADLDKLFRGELLGFRQLDLVRVVGRNRGAVRYTDFGMQEWEQSPGQLTCTLLCRLVTPEGRFKLVVPMQAAVDRATGDRQWQVLVGSAAGGFVRGKELTRYGWAVERVEGSGKLFAGRFLELLQAPLGGHQPAVWAGFVRPGGRPSDTAVLLATADGRAALAGGWAYPPPAPPAYFADLAGPLFGRPDGRPPTAADRAKFVDCWTGQRLFPGGRVLRDSPDVHPVLRLTDTGAEYRLPIELVPPGMSVAGGTAARAKLVIRADDPDLVAALASDRQQAAAAAAPRTDTPPADLAQYPVPWRVVRIESDMQAVKYTPPADAAGGRPGMGG